MPEKNPKVYDELIEVFCKGVSDLTNVIIDSAKPMEDIMNNLKEKFCKIVIPVITENMENTIITIKNKTDEREKTEE